MHQTKMKSIGVNDFINMPSSYTGIRYEVTDKYLNIYCDSKKNATLPYSKKEFYWIAINELDTEKKRLHWLAHISEKCWGHPYEAYQAILKAKDKHEKKT